MLVILQKDPRTFELCRLNENGDVSRVMARIRSERLSKRVGGATYEAFIDGPTLRGSGTHAECREQVCAAFGINPMTVDGHTFTRKRDKAAWWARNGHTGDRPTMREMAA